MKSIIVYLGKYGATQQYAHWLGDALQQQVYHATCISEDILEECDAVIIGSSVYVGKLLISKWLKKNEAILKKKKLLFFIVCGTPPGQKDKLQQIVKGSISDALTANAAMYFLRGRMIIRKLSWKDRMVLKLGAAVTKDPVEKKEMLRNFDDVKKENLIQLIRDFRSMAQDASADFQRTAPVSKNLNK